jgi:hypothetical protein
MILDRTMRTDTIRTNCRRALCTFACGGESCVGIADVAEERSSCRSPLRVNGILGAWQRNKDVILGEETLRAGPAMPSIKLSPPTLRGQNPKAGFTLANESH